MIAQGDLHAALVSMPAVHQVLDTYELLENILMHLPLRRLLLAQRVNTSFRDLIYRSANINRVLFFNAATTESVDWYRTTDVQPSRESPYRGEWKTELSGKTVRPIMNPFVPVYQTSYRVAVGDSSDRRIAPGIDFHPDYEQPQTLLHGANHIAFSTPPRRFFCDYYRPVWTSWVDEGDGKTLRDFLNQRWDDMMIASSGSFKDMLVTHPPCRSTKILADIRLPEPSCYFARKVDMGEGNGGVQFGPLIQAAAIVSSEQRWWDKENFLSRDDCNTVEIVGGELWRLCPKTIDEITGWEMLVMMLEGSG